MKILIIGQAPPAVKQTIPYDTTLLYVMLGWANISKEQAQEMFDFEALVEEFPGHNEGGGHKKPDKIAIANHLATVLQRKINASQKIILLGNEARTVIASEIITYGIYDKYLFLPHPSKRNYSLIMRDKPKFESLLKSFLK